MSLAFRTMHDHAPQLALLAAEAAPPPRRSAALGALVGLMLLLLSALGTPFYHKSPWVLAVSQSHARPLTAARQTTQPLGHGQDPFAPRTDSGAAHGPGSLNARAPGASSDRHSTPALGAAPLPIPMAGPERSTATQRPTGVHHSLPGAPPDVFDEQQAQARAARLAHPGGDAETALRQALWMAAGLGLLWIGLGQARQPPTHAPATPRWAMASVHTDVSKIDRARREDAAVDAGIPASGDSPEGDTLFGLPRETVAQPLALFLVIQLLMFLAGGAVAPGLPLFARSLGLGTTAVGTILSAPSLTTIPLNVISGRATDARGRKPLMWAGYLLIAGGDILTASCTAFTPSLPLPQGYELPVLLGVVLLASRLILGLGKSAAETAERAFLSDLCDRVPAARGRLLAAQKTACGLGLVLGPLLGGVATEYWGPGAPFYCVGVAALTGAVVYGFFIPETRPPAACAARPPAALPPPERTTAGPDSPAPEDASVFAWGLWWDLLQSPSQRALLTAVVATSLGLVAQVIVLPLQMAGPEFGASVTEIGLLFSVCEVVSLASAVVSGWLADNGTGYRALAAAACLASSAGLFAASQAATVPQLIYAFGVWGVGAGVATPALLAYAQELAPKGDEGAALALPKTVTDVTILGGSVLLGAVGEAAGNHAAMALTAAINVVAALLVLAWAKPPPGAQPRP